MNNALSDDSSPAGEPMMFGKSEAGADARDGSSTSQTQTHAHIFAPQLGSPTAQSQAPGIPEDRTVISQKPVAAPAEFVRSLSLVELARVLEGRTLDHFAVDRMIGGGGMGAVFRGRDLRLDREVAIKVIPESRRDPETLRRFRMEAQSAARLDHPNIARVFDIGENETWNYIVFEFIDGINLRDLVLTNGPMTIDDAVFTTRQVAEALQHAHERDVVHRDIKPSNVIITPSGIAKVVDMGLARNTAMDRSTADQTASGVTLGTFDYISPEQARDPRDADVRSDLYSLGCTLFYMLTGQPPFPDGTALQKLLNHGSQPPPDPRQWRDDISDQLAAVLSKLMAKRPSDRYQRPIELINDLLLVAQLESLPRSASAGTILLTPAIAQRSLLELHLPWLVPLCVLIGSIFWLQSAESFSKPLEVPQPDLASAQRVSAPVSPTKDQASMARPITPATPIRTDDNQPPLSNLPVDPTNDKPNEKSGAVRSGSAQSTGSDRTVKNVASEGLENSTGETAEPAARTNNPNLIERSSNGLVERQPVGPAKSGDEATLLSDTKPKPADLVTQPAASTAGLNTNLSSTPGSGQANSNASPTDDARPAAADTAAPTAPRTSTYALDVIVVSPQNIAGVRWAPSLAAALNEAAMSPEIRAIELRESIELTSPLILPRGGLTLRSTAGAKVELTLSGSDAFGMGWEPWIELERKSLKCQGLRIRCLNDMRQHQAVFAMRAGGKLELEDCLITMDAARETILGNCIVVKDAPKTATTVNGSTSGSTPSIRAPGQGSSPALAPTTLMPSSSATSVMPMPAGSTNTDSSGSSVLANSNTTSIPIDEVEPVTIVLRNSVVRGAQSLITMRSVVRAEITMENVCAMLEGRVVTIRTDEDKGVPPVVRMNLQRSTLATQQGFAAIQAAGANRAPVVLMRTAKLCAFWSPAAVSHISIDGISDQDILDKLLLLRGEENAYDANIENLVQCRMTDGQHLQYRLTDLGEEWFRELGYENNLRWQGPIPPDRPMQEQLPSDYSLKDSMYQPGYK